MSRTHAHIPWFCTPSAKAMEGVDWRTSYEVPMNAWYESERTIPKRKTEQYEKHYSERRIRRRSKRRLQQVREDVERADDADLHESPERTWF